MFEQDYIMRQIKEITAVMAKVLFGAKTDQSFYMLQEVERQKAFALVEKMRNGEVKEAVDEVNRLADEQSKENLMIGLEFYSNLSDMDDKFFEEKGYSFVNAKEDFRRFAEKFGMQQMTNLYFGDGNDDD
jgi:DNA polymerase III gamma/tau subunit